METQLGATVRKRLIIYIPLIAVLLVLSAMVLVNRLTTPQWKVRLDQYLAIQNASGEPAYHLVSAVQASQPAEFTASMSSESYSQSAIFSTSMGVGEQFTSQMLPLPYPPDTVWCVLLKGNSQQQVVYIALHNSLYNADWVVHIPPQPFESPALKSNLIRIGCSFD
jgi:hypothetical protein